MLHHSKAGNETALQCLLTKQRQNEAMQIIMPREKKWSSYLSHYIFQGLKRRRTCSVDMQLFTIRTQFFIMRHCDGKKLTLHFTITLLKVQECSMYIIYIYSDLKHIYIPLLLEQTSYTDISMGKAGKTNIHRSKTIISSKSFQAPFKKE